MSLPDLSQHKVHKKYVLKQDRGQLSAKLKRPCYPKRGNEVYIKDLPRDLLMQEIFEFVRICGEVFQIRLLMDFSGYNRGFCFVAFCKVESARRAVIILNGKEVRPGCPVTVRVSFDNNKLLMKGIPVNITHNDIHEILSRIAGDGLKCVIMISASHFKENTTKGCFLQYFTHNQALEARKTLFPGVYMWGTKIDIDWAMPSELSHAQSLFFKNCPENVSSLELFQEVIKYVDAKAILNIYVENGCGQIIMSDKKQLGIAFDKLKAVPIFGRELQWNIEPMDWNWAHCGNDSEDFLATSNINALKPKTGHMERLPPPMPVPAHLPAMAPVGFQQNSSHIVPTRLYIPTSINTPSGMGCHLAIHNIIHRILNFNSPYTTWIYVKPNTTVPPHINVVRIMPTVNNVTYDFTLIEVVRNCVY